MIWKTRTHEFSATVCQRTGKTCPALARMARAIAQAMETAAPVAPPGFQVDGSSDLTHCEHGCTARFEARQDRIRVFCDTLPEVSVDRLDTYADMIFGDQVDAMPSRAITQPPCAMLQALTLAPNLPVSRDVHANL